jgi:hypothetical protein
MRAYMLTIRIACRRPFATITIVMVANGRRQPLGAPDFNAHVRSDLEFDYVEEVLADWPGKELKNISSAKSTSGLVYHCKSCSGRTWVPSK